MLILLTNDDSIRSEGILALQSRLNKKHEVYIVAPDRERTCIANAITLHKPLRLHKAGLNVFTTNGTPADCVYLAVRVVLKKKPDLLISGLNEGPNMGQDIHYSGTVAAAKEGAFLGIASMAVSLSGRRDFHFDTAIKVVEEIIHRVAHKPFVDSTFLNINIPNVPYHKIKEFAVTKLGKRIYNDTVIERTDPRGRKYYWIAGNEELYEPIKGTDFYAVARGYVSVTPLGLDTTNSISLEQYKKYFRR
jgi:5'-nucleotidase